MGQRIQRAGYARSRTWASQVIGLIKKYELFQYDERPEDYVEAVIPVVERTVRSSGKSKKNRTSTSTKGKMYTVKKGDNLNRIAERNGTSSAILMRKNGLKSSALQPGQKIKL